MKINLIKERCIEDLRSFRAKKVHNLRIEYAIEALRERERERERERVTLLFSKWAAAMDFVPEVLLAAVC